MRVAASACLGAGGYTTRVLEGFRIRVRLKGELRLRKKRGSEDGNAEDLCGRGVPVRGIGGFSCLSLGLDYNALLFLQRLLHLCSFKMIRGWDVHLEGKELQVACLLTEGGDREQDP